MANKIGLEHLNDGVLRVLSSDNKNTGMTVLWRRMLNSPITAAGIPDTLGVYMLVDVNSNQNGRWHVYVGKSGEAGLPDRISGHISRPPARVKGWDLAILLHSLSLKEPYSQNVCSALEHMLYAKMKDPEYDGIRSANVNSPPGEPMVPVNKFDDLQSQVSKAMSLIQFLGVLTDRPSAREVDDTPYDIGRSTSEPEEETVEPETTEHVPPPPSIEMPEPETEDELQTPDRL